jgi:hypothetical protein
MSLLASLIQLFGVKGGKEMLGHIDRKVIS